jgi:fibro-slime domain-containing protein
MKRSTYSLLIASAALLFSGSAASAESYTLTGTLRDFKQSHPDMQYPIKAFGVKTGLVEKYLDQDGKPALVKTHKKGQGMIEGAASFRQWFRDDPQVNVSLPYSIELAEHPSKPNVYYFAREKQTGDSFFPLDAVPEQCFNDLQTTSNGTHNYYFTYELETEFTYTPMDKRPINHSTGQPEKLVFSFTGDDDVWVFINDRLAVDIGGVHGQANGSVDLDAKAADLGIELGQSYTLTLFFAERHTTESNFRIETTLQLKRLPPTLVSALFD